MQQPPNLNSHISTLENLLVEGLCPWQGGWNLIIFKIPSNPLFSERNLRNFFPQSAQWSTMNQLPCAWRVKGPNSLSDPGGPQGAPGANTKPEHHSTFWHRGEKGEKCLQWERTVSTQSSLSRGQEGHLSYCEGHSSWNRNSSNIPPRALEFQSSNLTACVCNWWKVHKSADGSLDEECYLQWSLEGSPSFCWLLGELRLLF